MENMPSEIHVNMNGKISVLEVVNYGLEKTTKIWKVRKKEKKKIRQSPQSGEKIEEKRKCGHEKFKSEKFYENEPRKNLDLRPVETMHDKRVHQNKIEDLSLEKRNEFWDKPQRLENTEDRKNVLNSFSIFSDYKNMTGKLMTSEQKMKSQENFEKKMREEERKSLEIAGENLPKRSKFISRSKVSRTSSLGLIFSEKHR